MTYRFEFSINPAAVPIRPGEAVPKLAVTADGIHDASRLLQALASGNSEQYRLAREMADDMLRTDDGTRCLVLLQRHGGVDLTRGVTVGPDLRVDCPICDNEWRDWVGERGEENVDGEGRCEWCDSVGCDPLGEDLIDFEGGSADAWAGEDGDFVVVGRHVPEKLMRRSGAAYEAAVNRRSGAMLDYVREYPVRHVWATVDPVRTEYDDEVAAWYWFHEEETDGAEPCTLLDEHGTLPATPEGRFWVWCPGTIEQERHAVPPDEIVEGRQLCDDCRYHLAEPVECPEPGGTCDRCVVTFGLNGEAIGTRPIGRHYDDGSVRPVGPPEAVR